MRGRNPLVYLYPVGKITLMKWLGFIFLFAQALALNPRAYYTTSTKDAILFFVAPWLWYWILTTLEHWDLDWSVWLFMVWAGCSYLFHPYKLGNPLYVLLTGASLLSLYIVTKENEITTKNIATCLEWIVYALAVILLWEYRLHLFKLFNGFRYFNSLNYGATFGSPILLGSWLVLALPFLLYHKKWMALAIGLGLWWLSGSRSALIGISCSFAIILWSWLKGYWKLWLVGFLLIVAGFLIPRSPINTQRQDRLSFWESALDMTLEHPYVGNGLGSFALHYPSYRNPSITEVVYQSPSVVVKHAHNWALEMASELGLIGLGLFLLMMYRLWKYSDLVVVASTFGLLMANFTDVALAYISILTLVASILGVERTDKI